MIVTKEHQEALLNKYATDGHNTDECIGFIDGLNAALELVKNSTISVAVHQRNLLNWMQDENDFNIGDIDEILDDYEFYKANCD